MALGKGPTCTNPGWDNSTSSNNLISLVSGTFATGGIYFWFALLVVAVFVLYYCRHQKRSHLGLPFVGVPSGLLGTWRASFNYFKHAEQYLLEGYRKYAAEGRPFVIATFPRYWVILTDREHIEEMKRAKDEELSCPMAIELRMRTSLVYDPSMVDGVNDYHLDMIKQKLTQRLALVLPEVHEEVSLAWKDVTNIRKVWTRVKPSDALLSVVGRSVNRVFVGSPLCRNQELLYIMLDFAKYVIFTAQIADHVPEFLSQAVVWCILKRRHHREKVAKFLGPIFDERRRMQRELGERWEKEKPDDAIQWCLDEVEKRSPEQQTNEQLTLRVMVLNFASVHTTTISLLHVLYDLVTYPEYIEPLREEIISTLDLYGGYTKQALTAMLRLDSVLKESQRCNGVTSIAMQHVACREYTFTSGKVSFTVPKGTFLCAPAISIHRAPQVYGPDADEWKGFRFSDVDEDETKEAATKRHIVSTSPSFLAFGHGRHACPGRFFASNHLKLVVSYLLLKYHIRLTPEWNGKRPANVTVFGSVVMADTNVELEFKEREDWNEIKGRFEFND